MMRGILFDDWTVQLDPRTAHIGGSWIPGSGDPLHVYDPDALRLFWSMVATAVAPVALDVGANTGSFCLLATRHPRLRVWAFEPVSDTFEVLRANIEANDLGDRVTPVRYALSDVEGQEDMLVPLEARLRGLAFLDDRPADMPCQKELVRVTTLDRFCAWTGLLRIHAIKIDVEGIEAKVLRGGEQTIRRDLPLILMEPNHSDVTTALLRTWGYTCEVGPHDVFAYPREGH
jgi:FkbM family methyltransferase